MNDKMPPAPSPYRDHVQVRRLYKDAMLPFRAMGNSIGLDVSAYLKTETGRHNSMLIPACSTRAVPTGLCLFAPQGHTLLVCSRSGMATRSMFVANAPGVVDPDYTGEIIVLLFNGGMEAQYVRHEDRIAQVLVVPLPYVPCVEVGELPKTERGDKGFGSTGQ